MSLYKAELKGTVPKGGIANLGARNPSLLIRMFIAEIFKEPLLRIPKYLFVAKQNL
jgi:hypothetical protein